VTSFCPTQNWWEKEKPATGFASFTKSEKCIFSKRLSTSLSLMLSFSEFGACLAQNNTDQE